MRFFETSDPLLAVLDDKGRFMRVNPRWTSLLGYAPDDLLGAPIEDVVHPDDYARLVEGSRGDVSAPNPVVLRLRARDGAPHWVSWSAVPDRIAGSLYCTGSDMDDWMKSLVPGVQSSEGQPIAPNPARSIVCGGCDYTSFFERSTDLLMSLDSDGDFWKANHGWYTLLGHHPETLKGTTFIDVVHEEDRGGIPIAWRQVATGDPIPDIDLRMRTAGGSYRAIRWSSVLDRHDTVVHAIGRDLQEVEQAQEGEAQLRAIMENMPDPILSVDSSMNVVDINRATCATFGYQAKEVVGHGVATLIPGIAEKLGTLPGTASPERRQQPRLTFLLQGVRSSGDVFPLRASVSQTVTEGGSVLTILARDLTQEHLDRARHLDEVRAMEASSIHLSLANELHDGLLQSLTGASLQLEVIQRLLAWDPASAHERLNDLQTSLVDEQRALRFFVDEFKSGGDGWANHDAPLEARLQGLVKRVEGIWGIDCPLTIDVDEEPSVSRAHEILRLAHEAVVNAARHGGATNIAVSVVSVGDGTHLHVADNGSGFEFDGRLLHNDLMSRPVGPLRLKQRVADNNGTITIESSEAGAVVTVRLPEEGELT